MELGEEGGTVVKGMGHDRSAGSEQGAGLRARAACEQVASIVPGSSPLPSICGTPSGATHSLETRLIRCDVFCLADRGPFCSGN